MRELREQSWIASMPLGFATLEREAGEFFLRSRAFTFPGLKIAEIFQINDGPLYEEIRRNILHINGKDHSRLRGLVNPAFTPRAVEKWRPAMRGFLASCGTTSRTTAATPSKPSASPIHHRSSRR